MMTESSSRESRRAQGNLEPATTAHVVVRYGNRGVLCLTGAEYDAYVSRNRIATAAPARKRGGIVDRIMRGGGQ